MSMISLTYMFGELSLYYAVIGFAFLLFGYNGTILPQAAVLFSAELLCAASGHLKSILRYLPLILTIPAILLGKGISGALLAAPIVIILFLRIRAESFSADRELLHSMFRSSLGVYALIIFIALICGKGAMLAETSLPFFIIWLLCAVFCMRLLRVPDGEFGARYKLLNASFLAGTALVGCLLSSKPVTAAVIASIRAVYQYFIAPLLLIVLCAVAAIPAAVFYGLFKLISLLGTQDTASQEELAVDDLQQLLQDTGTDALVTSEWLTRFAAAVGILLFLFLAYFLVRKFVSTGSRNFSSANNYMHRVNVPASGAKKRESMLTGLQEDSIRVCYRKYLALAREHNVATDGSLTSDEVMREATQYTGAEDASLLRNLWLPVRYGNMHSGSEEIKAARSALQSMRIYAAGKKLKKK